MTFLADIFRDLANDPSWPWGTAPGNFIVSLTGHIVGEVPCTGCNDAHVPFIAQSPLTMARLALMVVDAEICTSGSLALDNFGIDPNHYAKVKKRVEEAKDG